MEPQRTQTSPMLAFGVPIAIVLGFGLIAAAIYFSGTAPQAAQQNPDSGPETSNQVAETDEIPPVTEDDYIRGNPNAPIMLVEYSDYDCPFCKRFHDTMKRVMSEFGESGDVAWVYRHFPLEQLHPNAPRIAVAAECVGDLGGNEAFWTFSDLIFDERDTNEATNMVRLPEFAEMAGVERAAFEACVDSGRFQDKVTESVQTAAAAGARGTPHTFILVGDQQAAINGAQPYPNVRQIVQNLQEQLGRGEVEETE